MELVVRQISGLGNQLFQYAAGRYYARQYGASLRLALDPPEKAFSYGIPRPFLLSHFRITAPASPETALEEFYLTPRRKLGYASALVRSVLGLAIRRETLSERHTFIPDLGVSGHLRRLYIFGYWQTYRIPEAIEEDLRAEFAFREPPTGKNAELLQQIRAAQSAVSLHIRRGDYASAAEGNRVLPMSYYEEAIASLRRELAEPTFFIFSDDPEFARANLPQDLDTVFVTHNDDITSFEDLRLMSHCSHHIIANSSFSWWGAWLNPDKDKIVFAPRQWMMTPTSFFPELNPPSWRLLDVV